MPGENYTAVDEKPAATQAMLGNKLFAVEQFWDRLISGQTTTCFQPRTSTPINDDETAGSSAANMAQNDVSLAHTFIRMQLAGRAKVICALIAFAFS